MAVYISSSVADTEKLAARLAEKLRGGEVIAFTGSMGMGKTAFTRGLVLALGGGDVVSSPTFALVNEYETRLTVQHFDMYRVSGWDDLYSTGFFDYLDTDNVLVIEWSENIDGALPDNTIRIDIQKGEAETERIITIDGVDL
ncbi:tRNA (adenosine(37)-N6)-threonylcarbamoyltransferase complex ATPase subunit type 1 TsaE [Anaeromassilibacillus senegalensis]|uniref:tRNA threonylcarbamoyladenosine biosynthesis protein TsaE n=1 Tax=Anaeromassilibacillus senegalensis TaxID=1673717 RepID=A0ABS9CPZ7_9FIRM|nr:tRNA (adenosine(37)-N6)-threonylcarbamoyltransferase complex ATPase subunit type 1 TsaE [Anaeromassilibacillus senegalensis]MCF2652039.1 tRNA (adenosine(37)-N6)-threonylcarbamoyltransferase complex ATPase subunit type 1 TsaE [Anaeromassilibacillus senegalensis]MCI5650740.1 tRNA (adenosine(37)-N6)-threonylcarbamoyltransferase complex ATPase subunit type 1 TsaE [Ruminococcus bromii]